MRRAGPAAPGFAPAAVAGKRASLHAPCQNAACSSRASTCLVPYWAAPAGVLLGGMALRACGGGAWRVAGFRLCQHALWVLRGRPRSPTPVWRAPRHLCKSSSLAVFKYQSMPQKCRDIGDPQSCRETEGVPSAHLAVRWLFYYHPSSATSSIQLLLWHLQEPDASVAPPLEAARTGARTGQQHLAGDRASRRER